ncbi:MAG: bacteriohemerythrin [Alphaproteobacteria bacterium]|nr:bacteriohemerythrin [Alphaproteobacteria bacterium]
MARINKVEVTTGVWWLDVPDAGLRILCGCPADIVKHLMKRGLIARTERAGVVFETGPNVILLSDVMVQNGSFSNLVEFPVLQMLYRQGMILPNHPNNTGQKPMLIGLPQQVSAQLQYIYRGNYGLISEEEMVDAGLTPDQAREQMRMKLKFAFGKIRHPAELIDSLHIEGEKVEIRNGLFVRRLRLNVFEFEHGDETMTVDLNLPLYETYEAPYPLGMHQVARDYFAVVHSGEGDGWDFNRPSMGSILMYQGKAYLIDAGPNIMSNLTALGISVNEIEGVFHTHSHDDHFAGLPTLIRSDHRIKYFATPLVRASVTKKLAALLSIEEDSFADYFEVCDLEIDAWNDIEGLEVKPILSPHPVETTVFLFRGLWEGGWRTYAHLADLASRRVLESMITADDSAPGISQTLFDKVMVDYMAPATVKKVDIGGGPIHGDARDFRDDRSGKIILAHTAHKHSDEEKAIGSGAPFGTVDVFIPGNQDYAWRYAWEFLAAYFPTVKPHQLRMLMNNKVVAFNPESMLIKEGVPNDEIFLVMTGNVEVLSAETGLRGVLSAGALIGELSGLHGLPAMETYRAVSFVQALRLPCDLYLQFVTANDLFAGISLAQENREFLQRTWLFGEVVSAPVLNRIAKEMKAVTVAAGAVIEPRYGMVMIVKSGRVRRLIGEDVVEVLDAGDFFGEETALFETPGLFRLRALEAVELYQVPAITLSGIPGVRWKLFETHERRMRVVAEAETSQRAPLIWRDEYSVDIQRIDTHHRRLFEMVNGVIEAVQEGRDRVVVLDAMDLLLGFTMFHFNEEEELLKRYGYADAEHHCARHRQLVTQVRSIAEQLTEGGAQASEAREMLKDWVLAHVLSDDGEFVPFLHAKGIY